MGGRLYVVGVGPGDPELLTLKGARILGEVGCICVPKGREEGTSLALSIIRKAVNIEGKEILETYFPMMRTAAVLPGGELDVEWQATVAAIVEKLDRDIDTAFITIGDPAIYSTFFYICEKLLAERPDLPMEIVPGVSSINASAAVAGLSLGLGDDKIAIMPANYLEDLEEVLVRFSTVVLMKVYRVFDEVVAILSDKGLLEQATYVSKAGMEEERICTDLRAMKKEELDYFSLIIVRKQREKRVSA